MFILLRHLPSGDGLRSVQNRIQSPEIPEAHNLSKVLLGCHKGCPRSNALTMPLSGQRQTLRVRMRTPACGHSIMFVLGMQRCSDSRKYTRHLPILPSGRQPPTDILVPVIRPVSSAAPCRLWIQPISSVAPGLVRHRVVTV